MREVGAHTISERPDPGTRLPDLEDCDSGSTDHPESLSYPTREPGHRRKKFPQDWPSSCIPAVSAFVLRCESGCNFGHRLQSEPRSKLTRRERHFNLMHGGPSFNPKRTAPMRGLQVSMAGQCWRLRWRSQLFFVFAPHAHSDSSCCEVSLFVSIAGSGSAGSVPWAGAPHAGHGSAFFDVISAPQHPQKAAMHILRSLLI